MHHYGKVRLKSRKHYQGLSRTVHSRETYYKNFHHDLHSTILHTQKRYGASRSQARQCALEASWDLRDILNN